MTDLFNVLTGVAKKDKYRELLVAPKSMRPTLEELIETEVERHREHALVRPGDHPLALAVVMDGMELVLHDPLVRWSM